MSRAFIVAEDLSVIVYSLNGQAKDLGQRGSIDVSGIERLTNQYQEVKLETLLTNEKLTTW